MMKAALQQTRLAFYNRRWATDIRSVRANLGAEYGVGVLISPGTVVGEDVRIGDYSYVNSNSSIENCSIGKYTSVSSGVYICPFEHDINSRTQHPVASRSHLGHEKRAPVVIGNDVLISLNVVVLSGVSIGNGAVIGAGAVVTKDVPAFQVVGGVPARVIRPRFAEQERAEVESLAWWNWPRDRVLRNRDFLAGLTNEPLP